MVLHDVVVHGICVENVEEGVGTACDNFFVDFLKYWITMFNSWQVNANLFYYVR